MPAPDEEGQAAARAAAKKAKKQRQKAKKQQNERQLNPSLSISSSPPESPSTPPALKPGAPQPKNAHPQTLLQSERNVTADLSALGACTQAGDVVHAGEDDRMSADICLPDTSQPNTDAEKPKPTVALPDHCVQVMYEHSTDSSIKLDDQVGSSPSHEEKTGDMHDCDSKAGQACLEPSWGLSQTKDENKGCGNVAADRGTVLSDTGSQAVVSKDAAFLQMLFCCPITKVMS